MFLPQIAWYVLRLHPHKTTRRNKKQQCADFDFCKHAAALNCEAKSSVLPFLPFFASIFIGDGVAGNYMTLILIGIHCTNLKRFWEKVLKITTVCKGRALEVKQMVLLYLYS